MGLDLRLLPLSHERFSDTQLYVFRAEDLFEAIQKIEQRTGKAVKEDAVFIASGEGYCTSCKTGTCEGCCQISKTHYGIRTKYVLVEELLFLHTHKKVLGNPTNRAVWAYLTALPAGTEVALYWH